MDVENLYGEGARKVKVMINQIIAKANSPFPPDSGHDGGGGGQYTAEMMIPGPKVGLLIGKGGENIKNLQEKGGVKMVLIQDGPQQTIHEKPLRISGDPQKVEFAKQMVIDLLAQKDLEVSRFANGAGAQEDFMVPRQAVGVVIGKSGEMIKRIQNDSGARVQFIQGKEDIPGDKLCQITGHPDQVQKAGAMIQELIQSVLMGGGVNDARGRGRGRGRGMGGPGMRPDFGPGGPRMRGPPDGPAAEIQYPVPANKCGLVIGKGGETVRGINQQSGAHVEIARGAQPNPHEKMFIIRGSPQQIEHAKQLINERIGMPPQGPPGGPPQGGPPNQFQPQYPQQFQQPGGPGQPYGAPNWGNPYQQWPTQPASAGVAVAPNDPTKVAAVDPNAAWAAYYAQFYGQPGQPQPGQVQPQQQPQPAAGAPPASQAPAPASTPGGQPDYSAAWAEYYRSLGMYREAEMIEQQARTNQGGQPTAPGAPAVGAPAMGPPNPAAAPAPQPGAPPQPVTPAGTPAPGAAGAPYPGVYSQPGQQPAPGQVAYGGGYPGYNYGPYGAQQQFAAPAPQ